MQFKIIKTETEYEAALLAFQEVFHAPANTPDGEKAALLALLLEAYEAEHHPILPPDPIEAIRIRMEEKNLKQKDLVGIIGGKSRVSEVLGRRKRLTLEMIRQLTELLQLPAEVLIQEYELR